MKVFFLSDLKRRNFSSRWHNVMNLFIIPLANFPHFFISFNYSIACENLDHNCKRAELHSCLGRAIKKSLGDSEFPFWWFKWSHNVGMDRRCERHSKYFVILPNKWHRLYLRISSLQTRREWALNCSIHYDLMKQFPKKK